MVDATLFLPDSLVLRITELDPTLGPAWLGSLPRILFESASMWSLDIDPPYPNLTYNYVAPVTRADGTAAVIKVGIPGSDFSLQIDALRAFDGQGSIRLLDEDADSGIMIMERLSPGTPLTTLANDATDTEATLIAASVMRHAVDSAFCRSSLVSTGRSSVSGLSRNPYFRRCGESRTALKRQLDAPGLSVVTGATASGWPS